MIEVARWSVSTTSPSSASDLLKSFASLALTVFAAVNSERCFASYSCLRLGRSPFWFALPAVGFALLACCWLCSSRLLLAMLFRFFSHCSRSSMFSLLSVFVSSLLLCCLFATCSSVVMNPYAEENYTIEKSSNVGLECARKPLRSPTPVPLIVTVTTNAPKILFTSDKITFLSAN